MEKRKERIGKVVDDWDRTYGRTEHLEWIDRGQEGRHEEWIDG